MDWECFSCFIKSLLSALGWSMTALLSVFSKRLPRDWMTIFLCVSVSSFCCSSCCLPCHLMVDTCALMDIRTSQAIDRSDVITPCSSHSCLTAPNLLHCGKPSGSGASFPLFLPLHPSSWFSGAECVSGTNPPPTPPLDRIIIFPFFVMQWFVLSKQHLVI